MPPRIFSRPGTRRRLERGFGDLLEGVSGGGDIVSGAVERAQGFDPSQAVSTYGAGFLDEAREGLGQEFEGLVGSAVGSGRLRTGFFQRDAGRLFQDFNRRVANAVAMQSLNAAQLDLQNIQGLSRVGTDLLTQQADVLGGAFDRATAEENAQGGSLFGRLAGAAAGFVLPGVGNVVGQKLGDKIAGAFS